MQEDLQADDTNARRINRAQLHRTQHASAWHDSLVPRSKPTAHVEDDGPAAELSTPLAANDKSLAVGPLPLHEHMALIMGLGIVACGCMGAVGMCCADILLAARSRLDEGRLPI